MQVYASMRSYAEAFKWLNDTLREEYVLAAYKEIDFDENIKPILNNLKQQIKKRVKLCTIKP